MRQSFEKDLITYNEIAKQKALEETEGPSAEEINRLEQVLDWHLEQAAKKQHTNTETQQSIFNIQEEKQRIMQKLHQDFQCLDDPNCAVEKQKDERLLKFDEKTNSFIYQDDERHEQAATSGSLLSDMNWDIFYHIDKNSVPRAFAKKYFLERSKKELLNLLDLQIIKSESEGDIIPESRKEAYRVVEYERSDGTSKERMGFVAENLVKGFLQKLIIDQRLPLQMQEANVFQDVEQKIDFIIHHKEQKRGVDVEVSDKIKDLGIQLTVNPNAVEHKKTQIEHSKKKLEQLNEHVVDDIALILFSMDLTRHLIYKWQQIGRPSGGPDQLLKRPLAEKLFKKLTKDMLNEKEVSLYWEQITSNFSE